MATCSIEEVTKRFVHEITNELSTALGKRYAEKYVETQVINNTKLEPLIQKALKKKLLEAKKASLLGTLKDTTSSDAKGKPKSAKGDKTKTTIAGAKQLLHDVLSTIAKRMHNTEIVNSELNAKQGFRFLFDKDNAHVAAFMEGIIVVADIDGAKKLIGKALKELEERKGKKPSFKTYNDIKTMFTAYFESAIDRASKTGDKVELARLTTLKDSLIKGKSKKAFILELQKIASNNSIDTKSKTAHELVHAVFSSWMDDNPTHKLTKTIGNLFAEAKAAYDAENGGGPLTEGSKSLATDKDKPYWYSNVDEFLSEALAEPELLNALANVVSKERNGHKGKKDIFHQLVAAIKTLINTVFPNATKDNKDYFSAETIAGQLVNVVEEMGNESMSYENILSLQIKYLKAHNNLSTSDADKATARIVDMFAKLKSGEITVDQTNAGVHQILTKQLHLDSKGDRYYILSSKLNEEIDKYDTVGNALKSVDMSRVVARPAGALYLNRNNPTSYPDNINFGNPFMTPTLKGESRRVMEIGDKHIVGGTNKSVTRMYYHWLVDDKLPEGVSFNLDEKAALERRREAILSNLDKVSNASKLFYTGTAKDELYNSHVAALLLVAKEKKPGAETLGKRNKPDEDKAPFKLAKANKYIGFGDKSTGQYADNLTNAGFPVNTGEYTDMDVVFASVNGNPTRANLDMTIVEIRKALEAGATVILDSKEYTDDSEYNKGEKEVYDSLLQGKYIYKDSTDTVPVTHKINGKYVTKEYHIGEWTKNSTTNQQGQNNNSTEQAYTIDKVSTAPGYTLYSIGEDEDASIIVYEDEEQGMVIIEQVQTDPKYRGKGYAKAILNKIIEDYGDKKLILSAEPKSGVTMDGLIKLYESVGFVVDDTARNTKEKTAMIRDTTIDQNNKQQKPNNTEIEVTKKNAEKLWNNLSEKQKIDFLTEHYLDEEYGGEIGYLEKYNTAVGLANGDIPFQHKSNLPKIGTDVALFEKMKAKLLSTFHNVQVKELDKILDNYGAEVLGRVVNNIIEYNPNKAGLDTLPHEYAHIYIKMFKDSPIVKQAIKQWGSEEALVQAIGEQAVKQRGAALNWWAKFSTWVRKMSSGILTADREELKNMLTDSFLTNTEPTTDAMLNKDTKSPYIAKDKVSLNEVNEQDNTIKRKDSIVDVAVVDHNRRSLSVIPVIYGNYIVSYDHTANNELTVDGVTLLPSQKNKVLAAALKISNQFRTWYNKNKRATMGTIDKEIVRLAEAEQIQLVATDKDAKELRDKRKC